MQKYEIRPVAEADSTISYEPNRLVQQIQGSAALDHLSFDAAVA
jgi:hypothetical protein